MKKYSILFLVIFIFFAVNAYSDTTYVYTFQEELHSWATPHVETFQFPDTSQTYSKITMYYTIGCPEAGCDPWDRLGRVSVIEDTDSYEIARIITPYNIVGPGYPGECTWEIDVTPYQSILRDSVSLSSYIETWIGGDQGWLVTITFEFIEGPLMLEPYEVVNLWQNNYVVYGEPADPIEDHLDPRNVEIDADADSVMLRVTTTGHGQGNTDNAAEFSYKEHTMVVNDDSFSHYLWRDDCSVNPCSPQGGTWVYDRAGWCPGADVIPWDLDITESVTPGDVATIDYNVEEYINYCRPTNPDCVSGETCPDCDYNYTGHTEPHYTVQSQLIMYKYPPAGSIVGTVTDGENPLQGVEIKTSGFYTYETITDENGDYQIPIVLPGDYTLSAYKFGYEDGETETFTVNVDQQVEKNFELPILPTGNLTGIVNDAYADGNPPIANAELSLLNTPLSSVSTNENGEYEFVDVPIGTYTVYVNDYDYLSWETEIVISAGQTTVQDFHLIPIYSFEEDDEGFVGDGEWEWGIPQESGGAASAFHGEKCWGTDLDSTYFGPSDMYLTTPAYELGATAPPYELSFYHWFSTSENWDGGQIQISIDDGESWQMLTPDGGYPYEGIVGLEQTPGFSGASNGWQYVQCDLSQYAGDTVKFRFWFGAFRNLGESGWFIDHFVVKGLQNITGIEIDYVDGEISAPQKFNLYQNYPNPFNPNTTIKFGLPQKTDVVLSIYDVTGRLVRTLINRELPAGRYKFVWDGKDEGGSDVRSGVYLYQLETSNFRETKQMTVIR